MVFSLLLNKQLSGGSCRTFPAGIDTQPREPLIYYTLSRMGRLKAACVYGTNQILPFNLGNLQGIEVKCW